MASEADVAQTTVGFPGKVAAPILEGLQRAARRLEA